MKYNNELVGISYARSYKELSMWKAFLDTLKVNYYISNIPLEEAVKLGVERFRYANEYCYTRKATLGEYIDLVENKKCSIILVASRVVEGNVKCNTTRFVAFQIAEYFQNDVKVIDAPISTNKAEAEKQLYKLARNFTDNENLIVEAIKKWNENQPKPKKIKETDPQKINLFFIGGAPFHFSFSDQTSYMTRYLTEQLGVNIIGPKTASQIKNIDVYKKAYRKLYMNNINAPDHISYWFRASVLASYYMIHQQLDGVIFVRDKYCTAKIEEIDLLQKIIDEEGKPNILIDYRSEAKATVETILDTFVEMLKWRKEL